MSAYLHSGTREEEPVGGVRGIQRIFQQVGPLGGVDQQHVVQPPAGLVAVGAAARLLGPAHAHPLLFGAQRHWQQVHHRAAVRRGPEGDGERER